MEADEVDASCDPFCEIYMVFIRCDLMGDNFREQISLFSAWVVVNVGVVEC